MILSSDFSHLLLNPLSEIFISLMVLFNSRTIIWFFYIIFIFLLIFYIWWDIVFIFSFSSLGMVFFSIFNMFIRALLKSVSFRSNIWAYSRTVSIDYSPFALHPPPWEKTCLLTAFLSCVLFHFFVCLIIFCCKPNILNDIMWKLWKSDLLLTHSRNCYCFYLLLLLLFLLFVV